MCNETTIFTIRDGTGQYSMLHHILRPDFLALHHMRAISALPRVLAWAAFASIGFKNH